MKKTAKKFSLGVKIASILTCVVIAAAGFASWLIISPAESAEKNGSFTVYTVETSGVTITVNPEISTVIFGKSADTFDTPWLVATDVAVEVLTAKFNVTIASGNESAHLNSVADEIKVSFNIKDNAKTAFLAAMDANYIAAPKLSIVGEENANATYANGEISVTVAAEDVATQSFTVTVEFGWGSATDGLNPFKYYNEKTVTVDLANKANALLTAVNNINSYLDGLGEEDDKTAFVIKVETVTNEPEATE